jgi:hypothetical protein
LIVSLQYSSKASSDNSDSRSSEVGASALGVGESLGVAGQFSGIMADATRLNPRRLAMRFSVLALVMALLASLSSAMRLKAG